MIFLKGVKGYPNPYVVNMVFHLFIYSYFYWSLGAG